MSWSKEEKREDIRTPYARPVSYMAMDGKFSHGEILDLGDGGVRILTEVRPLWEGTLVWARVPLSEPPITVPVLSQVRWVREKRAAVYEMGLQYVL
jgi:PilZ domain